MRARPRYEKGTLMVRTRVVLDELSRAVEGVDSAQIAAFADEVLRAGHIYVTGAGRSGLMVRALANRLMHLGLSVSVVGEVTAPHTKAGDLLVVGSGSGETASLANQAAQAKSCEMRLALVTASPLSTIGGLADVTVVIPAQAKGGAGSAQPMASTFEEASLLIYDALVLELMERTGQDAAELAARHANIE